MTLVATSAGGLLCLLGRQPLDSHHRRRRPLLPACWAGIRQRRRDPPSGTLDFGRCLLDNAIKHQPSQTGLHQVRRRQWTYAIRSAAGLCGSVLPRGTSRTTASSPSLTCTTWPQLTAPTYRRDNTIAHAHRQQRPVGAPPSTAVPAGPRRSSGTYRIYRQRLTIGW